MKLTDIAPGAEVYYAAGQSWRYVPPTRATIVSADRYRIIRGRQGAFTIVSHVLDPNGDAILVDLDEITGTRRVAVPVRELRGLWKETLAATGRTAAGVKAQRAAMAELATSGHHITGGDLLKLAATDEGISDNVFVAMARIESDGLVA